MIETDAASFRIWVRWLYTGRIFLFKEGDAKEEEFTRWGNCYAPGDFLQESGFGDTCIDTLIESMRRFATIPSDLPVWIYTHSTNDSQYRKLVVDIFATCAAPDTWPCDGKPSESFLSISSTTSVYKSLTTAGLLRGIPSHTFSTDMGATTMTITLPILATRSRPDSVFDCVTVGPRW